MSDTELIVTAEIESPDTLRSDGHALADLRQQALSVPVEVMQAALAEYSQRRKAFRDWLLEQFIEGVHYGVPPGCEVKRDRDGNALDRKGNVIPPEQWRFKATLYKAGADFVCDLLGARDEYAADIDGWTQAGSNAGTFVYACRLVSRRTGELLGEGRGIGRTGDEHLGANAAIKKAKKRAKVDAVLNTWGLSDLFTQDNGPEPGDPEPPPEHANPAADPGAPKVPPRAERGKPNLRPKIVALFRNWKQVREEETGEKLTKEAALPLWNDYVFKHTGKSALADPANWTAADVAAMAGVLGLDAENLQ